MPSAHPEDADAAAEKNPPSEWFCEPADFPLQRALLVLLARRVRKVYMEPGFFVFGVKFVNLG
jgi:hypothetical protein